MGAPERDSVIGRSLLRPVGPWQIVDVLDEIDSTNAESLRSPQAWRLVTASSQTAGRGRRSRTWVTPKGGAVAVSVTVPLDAPPATWGWLPLLTGLATYDALQALLGPSGTVGLKWPNDVLGRRDEAEEWHKLCGILCETTGSLVVAGVGMNVGMDRADLPVPEATSLRLMGHEVEREDVVVAFAQAFAVRHGQWAAGGDGFESLRAEYRRTCATIGTDVRVHTPDDTAHEGVAVGVAETGELIVELPSGRTQFAAADVVHVRRSAGGRA
jgi:BirA family transcriptional regulator, biotin operon repressor / biotin---[acetyl-CoA-carboxylase] ligase